MHIFPSGQFFFRSYIQVMTLQFRMGMHIDIFFHKQHWLLGECCSHRVIFMWAPGSSGILALAHMAVFDNQVFI